MLIFVFIWDVELATLDVSAVIYVIIPDTAGKKHRIDVIANLNRATKSARSSTCLSIHDIIFIQLLLWHWFLICLNLLFLGSVPLSHSVIEFWLVAHGANSSLPLSHIDINYHNQANDECNAVRDHLSHQPYVVEGAVVGGLVHWRLEFFLAPIAKFCPSYRRVEDIDNGNDEES